MSNSPLKVRNIYASYFKEINNEEQLLLKLRLIYQLVINTSAILADSKLTCIENQALPAILAGEFGGRSGI